jgi:hypothetical protein
MARLEARGLLVLAPLPARYPRTYHSDAGYVLTAEGLAAAGIEPIHLPLLAEACELFGITHRAVYGLYEHGMDSRRRAGLISAMQRLLDNSYRVTHVTNAVTTATGTDNRKANGYRLVDVSHAVAVERQHQVSRCNGYRDVDIANAVTVTDESTATDVAPCDTGNRCEVPS